MKCHGLPQADSTGAAIAKLVIPTLIMRIERERADALRSLPGVSG